MKTERINEKPEMTIRRWSILLCHETGHLHFAGELPDGSGRISSAISGLDLSMMSGRTESGSVYRLSGAPAANSDYARALAEEFWDISALENMMVLPPEEAALSMPAVGSA